jgi:hypothetical protein
MSQFGVLLMVILDDANIGLAKGKLKAMTNL